MANANKSTTDKPKRKTMPALDEESRENQLISLAIDCAEQQLLDGTASSQVIVHYLRLGSSKNKLELEKLKNENELLKAKTETIHMAERSEGLFAEVLNAIRGYRGEVIEDEQ